MKKYSIRIFFLLLTIVSVVLLNRLLSVKTAHGVRQAECMYYQPKHSIDVVMLGSSHIHCDINNALLWDEFGISSYDYSAAEQPLWITYHYLKEICKRQKPKVAVLDLYGPAHFKNDYQYAWLGDNLFGVRFSLNKLQMIMASAEGDEIKKYFPSLFHYHNRYKSLTKEDFDGIFEKRQSKAAFKGYTPYFSEEQQVEPKLTQTLNGGITVKSEIYLKKIIDFTREKNIELFLIVTPYITNEEDEMVYNRIREIAEYEGIQFNSTNYDYQKMGIDFAKDFNDDSHLNYRGSNKFTRYLAEELQKRYDLPDHRGDPYYESWDQFSRDLAKYVEENKD